jgi:hypothetical protein
LRDFLSPIADYLGSNVLLILPFNPAWREYTYYGQLVNGHSTAVLLELVKTLMTTKDYDILPPF